MMEMEDGEIVINGIGHRSGIDRLQGEEDEVEDVIVAAEAEEVNMRILTVDDNRQEIFHHLEADTVAARMVIEGHTPDREVHHLKGILALRPVGLSSLLKSHCSCKMTPIEHIFIMSKTCLRTDESVHTPLLCHLEPRFLI
jgi:hypothetical protein